MKKMKVVFINIPHMNWLKSKPAFPMEVLLNSESDGKCDYSNWKIPSYIKEGLLWLKQD